MQIHNLKKNIVWTLLVFLMVTGMSWGGTVYAAEHEEAPTLTAELTEEEKQAKLAQIGQQLEEVKGELIRLSLLVAKLALEEQVLALEQQLVAVQTEAVRKEETTEEEIGIAIGGPVDEQPQPEAGPPLAEAGGEEDVFGAISLEDQESIRQPSESALNQDEDKERSEGFLAALGPFRNLGTPELAALTILFVLGLFILVRRFRERRKRKPRLTENVPMKVPEDQPEPSPQSQGSVFQ